MYQGPGFKVPLQQFARLKTQCTRLDTLRSTQWAMNKLACFFGEPLARIVRGSNLLCWMPLEATRINPVAFGFLCNLVAAFVMPNLGIFD